MGKGFENLEVWKRSKDLAVSIYKLTEVGKLSKDFGLRDQMRRSVVSIASNIAEGDERQSDKDAVRFFYIAKGSAAEFRTQIRIACEIGFLGEDDFKRIYGESEEIGRMLAGIIKHRRP